MLARRCREFEDMVEWQARRIAGENIVEANGGNLKHLQYDHLVNAKDNSPA